MPKQTPHIPLPGLQLKFEGPVPLHRQIYEYLSAAIRAGHLARGTRLPSTRALARELGVSRTTIEEAYQDLQAEGYLEGHVGLGTTVVRELPDQFVQVGAIPVNARDSQITLEQAHHLSQRGQQLALSASRFFIAGGESVRAFRIGLPALDAFPAAIWKRSLYQAMRQTTSEQLGYQDPAGYLPLREEIATYLNLARGVRCTARQIIMISGAQMGLSLLAQLLLDPADSVWVEDPGYPWAKAILQGAEAHLVPVPIDEEGIQVQVGASRAKQARLAYVTPSHQFPLGVTMSLARRYELLRWASQQQAWIIEDDYDSEYRYQGRPIPALQGLDEVGRVLYLGTFSKVLFPALRLGYLVVPPALVEAFVSARQLAIHHPPLLEQMALAHFMATGEFTRHIRRMRSLYAERGEFLRSSLNQYLGGMLQVHQPIAGLHLIGWLSAHGNDRAISLRADEAGLDLPPLSAYALRESERQGFLLGYAALDTQQLKEGVVQLARVLEANRK